MAKSNGYNETAALIVSALKDRATPANCRQLADIVGKSQCGVAAYCNALVGFGMLVGEFNSSSYKVYSIAEGVRTDKFYCHKCDEHHSLSMINYKGKCKVCNDPEANSAVQKAGTCKIHLLDDVVDMTKPAKNAPNLEELMSFHLNKQINNLQMSL